MHSRVFRILTLSALPGLYPRTWNQLVHVDTLSLPFFLIPLLILSLRNYEQ